MSRSFAYRLAGRGFGTSQLVMKIVEYDFSVAFTGRMKSEGERDGIR